MSTSSRTVTSAQLLALAAVAALSPAAAQAADYWWNLAGGATGAWGTPDNWATDASGSPAATETPGALDTIRIASTPATAGGGAFIITLDGDRSVTGLVHTKGTLEIQAGEGTERPMLTIGAGGISTTGNTPRIGTATSPIDVRLADSQTWTHSFNNALANGIQVTGRVYGTAGVGEVQTLTVGGSVNGWQMVNFIGGLSDGDNGGKLRVVADTPTNTYNNGDSRKADVDFVSMTSTFSGGVLVRSGARISVADSAATPGASGGVVDVSPFGTGTITIENGGSMTLAFTGQAGVTRRMANNIVVSGRGVDGLGAIRTGLGNDRLVSFTGNITLTGTTRISGGEAINSAFPSLTLAGVVSDVVDGESVNADVEFGYFNPNDSTANQNDKRGTVILSNSGNNWGGSTTIIGPHTLLLNNDEVLPDTTVLSLTFDNGDPDNAKRRASTLNLGGAHTETIAGLASPVGIGLVQNSVTGAGHLIINGGSDATFGGTIRNNSGTGGTVALTKTGAGTQTLAGVNTYTGPTTIDGGTLAVTGSLGNTAVTINDGGTLAGSGSIAGTVTLNAGGTIAPGNSVGTITLGGLTLSADSQLEIEFNDTGNDLIHVTGTLEISGGQITLLQEDTSLAPVFTDNGVFHLIQYTGTLDPASLELLSVVNLQPGATYDFALSSDGGNQYVDLIVSVPEPASLAVMGLGALLFGRRRRSNV